MTQQILKIVVMTLDHFVKWGLGAVMMLIGTIMVALHDKLDLQFPAYLIFGIILESFGLIAYIVQTILHHQRKMMLIKNGIALDNHKKGTTK